MELNLKGKTVIVTGGSKGIGKSIKIALEKEGAKVTSWSRSEGIDLVEGIELHEYLKLKEVDILINNVGGMGSCGKELSFDIMFKNWGITQRLTDVFLEGKRKWGRVITIASIYGKEKGPNPYFTAAKSAQIAFMKSLAGKYKGITFNTISPGYINTKKEIKQYAKLVNAPLGNPEDIANMVVFLCSGKADFVNGANIVIDGGFTHSF